MQENYTYQQPAFNNKSKRVMGIPERFMYRAGVILFYVMLLFFISMAGSKSSLQPESKKTTTMNKQ